eukprot:COSAG04_NODE_2750_length_3641_cov_2.359684_1_plen_25_part_10
MLAGVVVGPKSAGCTLVVMNTSSRG